MPKLNFTRFKSIFRKNELLSISISWIFFTGKQDKHLSIEV